MSLLACLTWHVSNFPKNLPKLGSAANRQYNFRVAYVLNVESL